MSFKILAAVATAALLTACGSTPMTPTEFREMAKGGGTIHKAETFEVQRPFAEVSKTFANKASECLNFSLSSRTKTVIGVAPAGPPYAWGKPTIKTSAARTELYFQFSFRRMAGPVPDGGWYYLVADASPLEKNKTRVDLYWRSSELLARAVKGWASGENMGCPDQTELL